MTLAEQIQAVMNEYAVDANGIIISPGKFEREPIYVPILWEQVGEGSWDGEADGVSYVQIDYDLADAFPGMLADRVGNYVALYEQDSGFVASWIAPYIPELSDALLLRTLRRRRRRLNLTA